VIKYSFNLEVCFGCGSLGKGIKPGTITIAEKLDKL